MADAPRLPRTQLHRNDICWDDAEADEVQSPVQLPAGNGPNQAMHQRWAGAGAGYGQPPPGQLTLAAMGSNGGGMASPSHGGGMVGAAAATGPGSQLPGEPSLRVSVRYAKKQNGGLLGALVGWVPQSKGNTRGTALQLRMSCGGQVVSVPLDPKGYAPASSPSMLLPQSLAGMVSSGGAGDVPALSPRGGKELTVELVCASGPLAGGRIPMHKLWEHMEQAEDIEYVPPRGQGANARRGSTGGGQAGAAALVPEGTAMELALFSSSGEARKVGILELAILRVDATPTAYVASRQLRGVGSGGGANNAPASPPSSTGSAGGANGMVSYGWGMAQHEQAPAAAPGPASGGLSGAGAAPTPGRQPLRMSSCVAMDAMLEAALRGSGCGREQLLVGGPWRWLLQRFAATFDVSDAYVLIAHLRSVYETCLWLDETQSQAKALTGTRGCARLTQ